MPSKAKAAFDDTAADISQLLQIHKQLGGDAVGRRRLEMLHKSALVLLTAVWEAYCEDLAAEALAHMVKESTSAAVLPEKLRRAIAKELKADSHEFSVWELAGDGWKVVLESRLAALRKKRNWDFNSPKAAAVNDFFTDALGMDDVSDAWHWSGMSVDSAKKKLNKLVELRGAIAHRGAASEHVIHKATVESYFGHIKKIVSKTGGRVNRFARLTTGVKLF